MEILEIGISDLGIPKIGFTTFDRLGTAQSWQIESAKRGRWQILAEEKCEQGRGTLAAGWNGTRRKMRKFRSTA